MGANQVIENQWGREDTVMEMKNIKLHSLSVSMGKMELSRPRDMGALKHVLGRSPQICTVDHVRTSEDGFFPGFNCIKF